MLLKFANSTNNPQLAAVLIEKAADLKLQVDETSTTPDPSPLAPDVEPPSPNLGLERARGVVFRFVSGAQVDPTTT
jgi:hypothetical protein